jgi:hypothetical protein
MKLEDLYKNPVNATGRILGVTTNIEGTPKTISLPIDDALFNLDYTYDANGNPTSARLSAKPIQTDFYHQVGFFGRPASAVIVYPLFTQAAYGSNGFYNYYSKECDSKCLTVKIPDKIDPRYETGARAFAVLSLLHYDFVTDIDVDKEFDTITSLKNVVYLYPNALYAKVVVNYAYNTFTLVRGHGYPEPDVLNGFDWKDDNSRFEYDVTCDNWQFYKIESGKMLNCYPSFRLYFDKSLLQELLQ